MNKLHKNLKKANKLLSCDSQLEEYIKKMEKTTIEIPNNLENDLLLHFNNIDTPNKHSSFKETSIKIFKIAACTIFALIMWNYIILAPINLDGSNDFSQTDNCSKNTIFKDKLQLASDFLLTPINFERNDE